MNLQVGRQARLKGGIRSPGTASCKGVILEQAAAMETSRVDSFLTIERKLFGGLGQWTGLGIAPKAQAKACIFHTPYEVVSYVCVSLHLLSEARQRGS